MASNLVRALQRMSEGMGAKRLGLMSFSTKCIFFRVDLLASCSKKHNICATERVQWPTYTDSKLFRAFARTTGEISSKPSTPIKDTSFKLVFEAILVKISFNCSLEKSELIEWKFIKLLTALFKLLGSKRDKRSSSTCNPFILPCS